MNTGLVSVRYAKALLDFAKEKNVLNKVYEEVLLLQQMFMEIPQFNSVLENPFSKTEDKRKLIWSALGGKLGDVLKKFVDVLLENQRETQLQMITYKFIELFRKEKNIHFGKLTTAIPISSEQENHIKKSLLQENDGTLELEHIVDKDILGGFILEIDGKRLDASVTHQLQRIKNEYKEKNRSIV